MSNPKVSFKTEEKLQKAILAKKVKGTSDLEIGQKYGATFPLSFRIRCGMTGGRESTYAAGNIQQA
jgi:hypothetical protein